MIKEKKTSSAIIYLQSGLFLDILNPKPEQINIFDIAKGLANKGHFAGQTPKFFSIAEHSIMVARLSGNLEGLLHDAAEAYLSDIVTPLKTALPDYKIIEMRLMDIIADKFKLNKDYLHSKELKQHDIQILAYEYYKFFKGNINPFTYKERIDFDQLEEMLNGNKLQYLYPHEAYNKFMRMYYKYKKHE
ncbi:MAG: hypothetical protein ACOCVF_02255 [bacterium]